MSGWMPTSPSMDLLRASCTQQVPCRNGEAGHGCRVQVGCWPDFLTGKHGKNWKNLQESRVSNTISWKMLNHHFIPGTKPYKSNERGTNTMQKGGCNIEQNKLGITCDTTRMEATTCEGKPHPLDAIYESKERNQEHSINENVGHE